MNDIKSMTGFGRFEVSEDNRKVTVEIKAVNHRYLEVNARMPKKLNFFDASIRNLLKNYIQRGKVDLFITYEDTSDSNVNVSYHPEIAKEYYSYLKQMSEEFGLEMDVRVSTLSRFPEILTLDEVEIDEEGIWKILEKAVSGACEQFVESRIREGINLRNDLIGKLDTMLGHVSYIEERSPKIISEYKSGLIEKVTEMLGNSSIDENRIVTEVTIFADKVCVDEELVRLRSHVEAVKNTLIEGGSIGRKLDFLAQEMNREANTILSKSTDLEISNRGIELKTEIEKVREQIQNIE
ncbi:MAG: YicC family protein [Lachnospiraceae bacterium]|nr:YicC family protein [Lachnospiraceae bacterium]